MKTAVFWTVMPQRTDMYLYFRVFCRFIYPDDEAVQSSEMLVHSYYYHLPGESNLHSRCSENLKYKTFHSFLTSSLVTVSKLVHTLTLFNNLISAVSMLLAHIYS
jgi:hypothetical protein